MSEDSLTPTELQSVFEHRIRPVVFPHAPADQPELVLAAGQTGASAVRAAGHHTGSAPIAVVSAADLRTFHPRFEELSRRRSPEAARILTEVTTEWLRAALRHARTTQRSLLLDGTSSAPDIAIATAGLFAKSGFTSSVIVAAVPRAESLLAATAKHVQDTRLGRFVATTSVAEHDAGFDGVRQLARDLEGSESVDRIVVIGRDGSAAFDSARSVTGGMEGASQALAKQQASTMSGPLAMRWLSELRAVTDYSLAAPSLGRPLADVLTELNRTALQDVLPALPLPEDSAARPAAARSIQQQLDAIGAAMRGQRRSDSTPAPVAPAPTVDRGISI